jgi:hypothetical protein
VFVAIIKSTSIRVGIYSKLAASTCYNIRKKVRPDFAEGLNSLVKGL